MKALALVVGSLLMTGSMVAQDLAAKCNCYYSTDCSKGNTCGGYGSCTASGKSDGTCSTNAVEGGGDIGMILGKNRPAQKQLPMPKQDPTAVYAAVDSYFQAFLKAVNQGGGVPDQKLVAVAQKAIPSKAGLDNVEYAVWVSMDAVMGWDFMYPNKWQRKTGYVGNIREVHGVSAASGIVDATRRGLLEAMQSGDATKVEGPLHEFWSKNPNFIPRHLGRCYPHGHDEVTDNKSAVACQIDTLERVATMLINTASSERSPRVLRNGQAPGSL